MRLGEGAVIAEEKLRLYLLAPRLRNDKSGFFAEAGYTQLDWRRLETDLREQILPLEAELSRRTPYGDLYTIKGPLRGPNGRVVQICSVWMAEQATGLARLVTAYPSGELEG